MIILKCKSDPLSLWVSVSLLVSLVSLYLSLSVSLFLSVSVSLSLSHTHTHTQTHTHSDPFSGFYLTYRIKTKFFLTGPIKLRVVSSLSTPLVSVCASPSPSSKLSPQTLSSPPVLSILLAAQKHYVCSCPYVKGFPIFLHLINFDPSFRSQLLPWPP
jgi:hypothetical protein